MSISDILNDQTPLALGSAVALGAGVVSVVVWVMRAISQIGASIKEVRSEVELLRQSVSSQIDGTVKRADLYRWILRVKSGNPELVLPEDMP